MNEIPTYIYLGDRLTSPDLRGLPVNAVRRADGRCIRGKNGSMLVEDVQGRRYVVLGRLLVKRKASAAQGVTDDAE